MVGCEGEFDAFISELTFGKVHYGGIVDHDVDGWDIAPRECFFGSGANGILVGEVELEGTVVYARVLLFESVDAVLYPGRVAACYDEMSRTL